MGLAKRVVQRASRVVDAVLPPPAGIMVLIYHRVGGGTDSAVDLPPELFEQQMAHLAEHHRVLTLAEALLEIGPESTPVSTEPGVVVTFDDGTADFCEQAVGCLAKYGVPATLYVATQFVEEGIDFPWGAPPASWAALRDALSSGVVSLGSHTHTHRLLDRLEPAEAVADLDRSVELLADRTGVAAADFAYPKAVAPSAANEVEVRRRFRSAALAGSRVNRPGSTDPIRLWRTPIQRSDSLALFDAKAKGGLRLEGAARSALGRVRYRGLAQ